MISPKVFKGVANEVGLELAIFVLVVFIKLSYPVKWF